MSFNELHNFIMKKNHLNPYRDCSVAVADFKVFSMYSFVHSRYMPSRGGGGNKSAIPDVKKFKLAYIHLYLPNVTVIISLFRRQSTSEKKQ